MLLGASVYEVYQVDWLNLLVDLCLFVNKKILRAYIYI